MGFGVDRERGEIIGPSARLPRSWRREPEVVGEFREPVELAALGDVRGEDEDVLAPAVDRDEDEVTGREFVPGRRIRLVSIARVLAVETVGRDRPRYVRERGRIQVLEPEELEDLDGEIV